MKRFMALILILALTSMTSNYVFAVDSFVVSLQTAKTLTYDTNNYYEMADVVEPGQDFYLFFCIDKTLDLYAYRLKFYYDKTFVELVKDNSSGSLIPMTDTEYNEDRTIKTFGDAPVKFETLFTEPHLQAYNICSTKMLPDGTPTNIGYINYLVSLSGESTVFPTKTEVPYYRLASIHFRVKQTAPEGQATFSLETDRFNNGVSLFHKDGSLFANSTDATKIISIHNFSPTLPIPPVATYNYNTIDNKWYLTLTKEDDPTVEIWYKTTLNGTYIKYTGPFPLDESAIIYSYTERTRGNITADSTTITFATPTVAANPPPGGYDVAPGSISLSSVPGGYDVYYTTNDSIGEPPNIATLTKYDASTPITFTGSNSNLNIKTVLGKNGVLLGNSFKMLNYIIRPNAPVATPNGGTHTGLIPVTLSTTTANCAIYYTLDGSTPTTSSALFDGVSPINITSTSTLKAIAVSLSDNKVSSVSQFVYTISPPEAPVANPIGGTHTGSVDVTLSTITANCAIYFTLDGSIPTTSSTLYDGTSPINITSTMTLKAIAVSIGSNQTSSVSQFVYTINPPDAPVANPNGGTHTVSVAVTLSTTTANCAIYYTLDGSTPTTSSALFDGVSPINITTTSTLKSIAVKDGKISPISQFTYTIVPQSSGGGGGGGGTTTVYKYISIEKLLTEIKYKVIEGKAVYEIPSIEGDLSGDYVIATDATQDEIVINFTLQHIIDGARGLKKFIIKTKTDSFILPFYNINYPLAVSACKDIKPKDVPVTLIYSRKTGDSSLIDTADLTKNSKFYSYTLTSYIDKVAFPMRYLVGYAQYTMPVPEVPIEKTLLGAAINGNIIQTPLYIDKTIAGKESVVLRTLSDHAVCMVYGDKRTYSDIEGDWSQDNIERLATLRIVNGRPEGFKPETYITRAELSALISRALGAVMKDTVATPFKDLDKIHWSYYEANNAQNWNLIQGYPDFTFKPEQQVTRLETIQMIANAIKYTNRDAFVNTTEAGKYLSSITDAESIESWAVPSVVMTLKYEIIKGYEDGSIRPNNPITRAETVTLIKRLLENFKLIN